MATLNRVASKVRAWRGFRCLGGLWLCRCYGPLRDEGFFWGERRRLERFRWRRGCFRTCRFFGGRFRSGRFFGWSCCCWFRNCFSNRLAVSANFNASRTLTKDSLKRSPRKSTNGATKSCRLSNTLHCWNINTLSLQSDVLGKLFLTFLRGFW